MKLLIEYQGEGLQGGDVRLLCVGPGYRGTVETSVTRKGLHPEKLGPQESNGPCAD